MFGGTGRRKRGAAASLLQCDNDCDAQASSGPMRNLVRSLLTNHQPFGQRLVQVEISELVPEMYLWVEIPLPSHEITQLVRS